MDKKLLSFGFLFLMFIGCGVTNYGSQENSNLSEGEESTLEAPLSGSKVILGPLAGARVRIYEILDNGSYKLLWTEQTSSGNSLDEIGHFDSHKDELLPDQFYLYEATGGCDWDVEDDGAMDQICTPNNGTLRAIVRGKDVIESGGLNLTIATELVYEKITKFLKYNFNKKLLEDSLKTAINSSIKVPLKDKISKLLRFNPIKDKTILGTDNETYIEAVKVAHQGKPIFSKPTVFGISKLWKFDDKFNWLPAENVWASPEGKIYVVIRDYGIEILDKNLNLKGEIYRGKIKRAIFNPEQKKAIISYIEDNTLFLKQLDLNSGDVSDLVSFNFPSFYWHMNLSNDRTKLCISGDSNIYVVNLKDKTYIRIIDTSADTNAYSISYNSCLFSPDGNHLYFTRYTWHSSNNYNYSLVDYNLNSGKESVLNLGSNSITLSPVQLKNFIYLLGKKIYVIDRNSFSVKNIIEAPTVYNVNKMVMLNNGIAAIWGDLTSIVFYDFSNPENPILLRSIGVPTTYSCSTFESKLYCAAGYTIYRINAGDISTPQSLGYFSLSKIKDKYNYPLVYVNFISL